jgi:Asp-tRNA(Asn)/Glu-tRNA(Gln) amidotransferase A subunit family amidase
MTTKSAPLYSTVQKLRDNSLDLLEYIHKTCRWVDKCEPAIQALVPEENREGRLHQQARQLLNQFTDPGHRPPLFGALVGVKDIFAADGFPMRAGSRLPAHVFAGEQASSVTKLLEGGALIVGKTVTTEFAYFAPGPTRNPHNLDYTPGGSSSGSAAGVAAGFCQLSLGTQTIGSVIRPGAYCGIYGFKPTFGKIATDGVLPCSQTVDHVGFFTQDIDGLDLAASVLIPGWKGISTGRMEMNLGIPVGPYLEQADDAILDAFWQHVNRLEHAGITVKRIPMFADISTINRLHKNIVAAEFARNHAALYAEYGHLYAPQSRALLEQGLTVKAETLESAIEKRLSLRQQLSETIQTEGINSWICPASKTPPPRGIASTGDPLMNLPWTYTGLPALSLPAGVGANNLPQSLQLVANFDHDEELLRLAQLIQSSLKE